MDDVWKHASCLVCGKALRPQRAKAADFPGTVKANTTTECQSCAEKRRAEQEMVDNDYSLGRHSQMLESAIAEAKQKQLLDAVDEAMLSVARAAAFGLDYAEAHPKASYAISHLLGPYREALAELQMTPASRADAQADVFTELLGGIGEPA